MNKETKSALSVRLEKLASDTSQLQAQMVTLSAALTNYQRAPVLFEASISSFLEILQELSLKLDETQLGLQEALSIVSSEKTLIFRGTSKPGRTP